MSIFNKSKARDLGVLAGKLAMARTRCVKLDTKIQKCEEQLALLAQLQDDLVIVADLLPIIGELSFQKEKWKLELREARRGVTRAMEDCGDELIDIERRVQEQGGPRWYN